MRENLGDVVAEVLKLKCGVNSRHRKEGRNVRRVGVEKRKK